MGARIAPPTGRPRLSWQQALQAVTRRHEGWRSRTPPQVKLADYSSRTGDAATGRGWGAFQTCEPSYRG